MTKNNKNKGFTLVELIVVLVILAILAALLVPALTGYIDKAKKSQVIAETRMLTQAAQTELSTLYATDEFAKNKTSGKDFIVASKDGSSLATCTILDNAQSKYNDVVSLAEVPSISNGKGSFFAIANPNGAIRWTVYNDGKGYIGIFCKEDGSMEAFKEKEVTNYGNYSAYYGKIICISSIESYKPNIGNETGRPTQTRDIWSKSNFYFLLGVKGYDSGNGWTQ